MITKHLVFRSMLILFVALSGCSLPIERSGASKCLPSIVDAIPSSMPQKKEYNSDNVSRKAMPRWWDPQLNFLQVRELSNNIPLDIVAYSGNIWVAYSETGLIRYSPDTHTIKQYEILGINGQEQVSDLLVTSEGQLWASIAPPGEDKNYQVLVRYNPELDSFEFIVDENRLLSSFTSRLRGYRYGARLQEMPNGDVLVVAHERIVLYDPETNLAKLILDDKSGFFVENTAVSSKGNIWFTTKDDFNLRVIDLNTLEINDHGQPPGVLEWSLDDPMYDEQMIDIYVDDQDRVWVNYFAMLETNQAGEYVWRQILSPAIFVDVFDTNTYRYKWSSIVSINQFSDGSIWFTSSVGIVKYDPKKEEWCWSSQQSSPSITEDIDGNLWVTSYDGQIYKYHKEFQK